jgi:hypothetical protein
MPSLFDPIVRTWLDWRSGTVPLPDVTNIPPARCAPPGAAGATISRDGMYFTVRVNQMHLAENRHWWALYDPLVVMTVAFNHGNERVATPVAIGPNLIERQNPADQARHGVVLRNLLVTGPHPYRGGDVDISLAFYRIRRTDHARSLLNVVDKLASSLGGPGEMAVSLRFAGALLDGVEALLGLPGSEYLAGQRIAVATSPLDPLTAQFTALLAPPVPPQEQLQVREAQLERIGGLPYRDSDFVLWSITGLNDRGDENLLSFYPQKVEAIAAVFDGEDGVKRAKAGLLAAYQQMRCSPDVTAAEAGRLFDAWLSEFDEEKKRLERTRPMPIDAPPAESSPLADEFAGALRRLDL